MSIISAYHNKFCETYNSNLDYGGYYCYFNNNYKMLVRFRHEKLHPIYQQAAKTDETYVFEYDIFQYNVKIDNKKVFCNDGIKSHMKMAAMIQRVITTFMDKNYEGEVL